MRPPGRREAPAFHAAEHGGRQGELTCIAGKAGLRRTTGPSLPCAECGTLGFAPDPSARGSSAARPPWTTLRKSPPMVVLALPYDPKQQRGREWWSSIAASEQ